MHVAIVGSTVSEQRSFLDRAEAGDLITVARRYDVMMSSRALDDCDVLVLEADASRTDILDVIAAFRARSPRTTIVLVDGALAPMDVAEAFRIGIVDYFATPWNAALLVERTEALAARHRTARTEPTDTGETT